MENCSLIEMAYRISMLGKVLPSSILLIAACVHTPFARSFCDKEACFLNLFISSPNDLLDIKMANSLPENTTNFVFFRNFSAFLRYYFQFRLN